MLDTIRKSWGWMGINPVSIEASNDFGNVIFRSDDGAFWRICPEELTCDCIAKDAATFASLWQDEAFLLDWRMDRLVVIAREVVGSVDESCCYCLKVPAVLGGKYEAENFGSIPRLELVSFSGSIAEQIRDLPDGERIVIKLVD